MKFKPIIILLLLFCSFFKVQAQYSPEQKQEIDSLSQLLSVAKDDTTKIYLRFLIGETGWIFRVSYWDSISTDCVRLLAKESITKKEQKNLNRSLAATYNNTGFIYNNQGDIANALKYFHRSLTLYEKIGESRGIARASNNIGLIYHEQENLKKALEYYHKALKIREKIGDKSGIANSLNNLAFIYESQKNMPMALVYLNKSLAIYQELEDKQGVAATSRSLGVIYQRKGETDKALSYHKKALQIQEEIIDKEGIVYSLNNIAEIVKSQGKDKLAKEYAEKSLKLSRELGFPKPISESSKLLSDIAKKEGRYKEGWQHFETFIKMRDSIRSQETEKSLVEQEMKYEYEKLALKDSLEDAQLQAVKDLKIKEQTAKIKQEQTQKYALIGGLVLMLVLVIIAIKGYQQKKRDNLLINEQKQEVEEKNKEITDSITYAKRIQEAILPPRSELNQHLKNGFVLYKPKDIVAGDFYWLEMKNDLVFFAAADCTGHGVPGAMVSVVCNSALNRAVREFGLTNPAEILNKVRELVIETFEKSRDDVKDGMDIALCALNIKTNELNYAGANNSLYLVRDGELTEYKADKQPIGIYLTSEPFTNHKINLQENDTVYIFTDGYADQFGGPKAKKFKYEPFRKMLLANQHLAMDKQKELLDKTFEDWKGNHEQVDDVCVIGVKV